MKPIATSSQNNSAALLNVLPAYAFLVSLEGLIIDTNNTFLNDLCFTRAELLGKKLEEIVSGGSKIFLQTHLYPLLKLVGKADEIYLSFVTRDKTEIPVLINGVLHEVPSEKTNILFGGIRISRRNEYEKELLQDKKNAEKALEENLVVRDIKEQLVRSQKELETQLKTVSINAADQAELTKVLSHDLQEPLRKISLFCSRLVIYEESNLSEHTLQMLQKITDLAEKVRKLLESLQKFNSLDSKKVKIQIISLDEIALSLNHYVNKLAPKIKIAFDTSEFESAQVTHLHSDIKLVLDMLKELIDNAVLYKNPEKEEVSIKISTHKIRKNAFTEMEGKYDYRQFLVITFANNGIGNFNSSNNAFELFKRSDQIINESLIGLTYCRRIAQLLNGEITVASNYGSETVFTITLPILWD